MVWPKLRRPRSRPSDQLRSRIRPRLVAQLGHPQGVRCVCFSPDGKQVLTGSDDQTARLWDTATGKELRHFIGHASKVCAVAFSPDGKQVLTGSGDKTARLWDLQSGKELRASPGIPIGSLRGFLAGRQAGAHRQRGQDGAVVGPAERQGTLRLHRACRSS